MGKKAPLLSVYIPEWETVPTSFVDTGYTPTPIPSSQKARIEGSVKASKVKETYLKLDHERVKAEFLRTIKKALSSSQKPTDILIPDVEKTVHPYEIFVPEILAPRTTRRTRTVQEASEPTFSRSTKPSTEDFNKLIIILHDTFNLVEADFEKQNKAHKEIV